MFDWNKPFVQKKYLGKANAPKCELLAVCEKPLSSNETHVVRVGDCIRAYYRNGWFYEGEESEDDLVNIPEKKVVERWVVLHSEGGATYRVTDYAAKQIADEWQSMGRKTSIHHIREEF